MQFRTGIGFDSHKFSNSIVKGSKIYIGGVAIECDRAIEAHSDGDVVLHACTDAMLGAIGSNHDIGTAFPNDNVAFKGASSSLFATFALKELEQLEYKICNLDVIVICEKPKLTPHYKKIKQSIAEILKIKESEVGFKAKTTEGTTILESAISSSVIITITKK